MKILKLPQQKSTIIYFEKFLEEKESNDLFQHLNNLDDWKSLEFFLFGKKCKQNRETINFSYNKLRYNYSGLSNIGLEINEHIILINLKKKIENLFDNKYSFNYILGNRYRSGKDNIGMHSDDEKDLKGPIVSISLGCNRFFDIKGKYNKDKLRLDLNNGSLLIMNGECQKHYKHGIPIQKKINNIRINLTFRIIV